MFVGLCTIDSKLTFIPKVDRFCKENLLRYLDVCYVNPTYHILKIFPLIGCEQNRTFKKLFSQDMPPLKLRDFAAVATYHSKDVSNKYATFFNIHAWVVWFMYNEQ